MLKGTDPKVFHLPPKRGPVKFLGLGGCMRQSEGIRSRHLNELARRPPAGIAVGNRIGCGNGLPQSKGTANIRTRSGLDLAGLQGHPGWIGSGNLRRHGGGHHSRGRRVIGPGLGRCPGLLELRPWPTTQNQPRRLARGGVRAGISRLLWKGKRPISKGSGGKPRRTARDRGWTPGYRTSTRPHSRRGSSN